MSNVLDEYKTSQINKMHRSRAFPDGECAAFFFSGWEQGFDEAIEYSKQEAILFAKWFFDYKKKRMSEAPTKIGFAYWANKPIEEYYELYLIEKEKVK